MGLIRAALGAAGGVVGDQWKEYFYCEALDNDVLVVKGSKRVSGRSSNRSGTDNIISNGSVVAVADGLDAADDVLTGVIAAFRAADALVVGIETAEQEVAVGQDRKSTRLNSSHS